MKKRKIVIPVNYLDRIPARPEGLRWSTNAQGLVVLELDNTGWANRVAQTLFDRPKVSYVDLDEMGSFLWPLLEGEKTITQLGELVEAHFGEAAHPLYERLARYFQILDSYHFVAWVKPENSEKTEN